MLRKSFPGWVCLLIVVSLFVGAGMAQTPPGSGKMPGYPEPRYAVPPVVNSVEELLLAARVIAFRDTGHNMLPGYAITGREKILFVVTD